MTRFIRPIAIGVVVIMLPLTQVAGVIHASGGNSTAVTVSLHRQDCTATNVGPMVGTARFTPDASGGEKVNPGGLEINTSVTAGMPRSSYGVYVLGDACQVLSRVGTLNTDDSGRGDLDVHILGSMVPPATSSLRVQVVAPAGATVPGPGPFTDVITSDPSSLT